MNNKIKYKKCRLNIFQMYKRMPKNSYQPFVIYNENYSKRILSKEFVAISIKNKLTTKLVLLANEKYVIILNNICKVGESMEKYEIKKSGSYFRFIQDEPIVRGSRKKILAINNKQEIAMFKYEREDYDCSEACSEKIAYEIAKVLGYACAKIELAIDDAGKIGVLNYYFSDRFSAPHTDIVAYLNKDTNERKNYYTISNIKSVLDDIDVDLFKDFIKIMIFDALIGEQDRHEENWGITEKQGKSFISPLYDNGDSLLREFKNYANAQKYYAGIKDFDAYIVRSQTLIYKEDNKSKYKHFELIKYLYDNFPHYIIPEINNLKKLTDEIIKELVNKIPDELLTKEHKEYIITYLIRRRNILLNIK